ncbi:hypothetical protein ACKQTC_07220 [Peptococcus simiae]|uniref:Uncharacterized protein n=1 Tax=Peptococcus simiae TaxID=1643805 RepID=A0ABW9H0D9_9FIRM
MRITQEPRDFSRGRFSVKWNEEQINTAQLLKAFGQQPLFGDKRAKTRWLVFKKPEVQ